MLKCWGTIIIWYLFLHMVSTVQYQKSTIVLLFNIQMYFISLLYTYLLLIHIYVMYYTYIVLSWCMPMYGLLSINYLNFEMLMLKELQLVHKNTPFNQNNRIKEQVFRISQIYIWVLDSYDTLIVYLSCKIARWS